MFCFCVTACSKSRNYEDATIYTENGQEYIKLKGRRVLMSHDFGGLFGDNTYEDSLLIPLPPLSDKIILGKDIPVEDGHYKYTGDILIDGQTLNVNLFYNNTDDNINDPLGWNGQYKLARQ